MVDRLTFHGSSRNPLFPKNFESTVELLKRAKYDWPTLEFDTKFLVKQFQGFVYYECPGNLGIFTPIYLKLRLLLVSMVSLDAHDSASNDSAIKTKITIISQSS
ncbi:hypothetical protein ACTFIV_006560 [Dictyostelium citrinum]